MKMSPDNIHYCLEVLSQFDPYDIQGDDFDIAVNDDQFASISIVETARLCVELIQDLNEENKQLRNILIELVETSEMNEAQLSQELIEFHEESIALSNAKELLLRLGYR